MSVAAFPELDLIAQCECGAVTLAVRGGAVSMFQCSCLNCQKISGTGHSDAVLFQTDAVRTSGATKSHSRPADSGATFTRYFCPECATTLYATSSRAPALRIIPVGLFAGDTAWFTPNQLIFARSHQSWDLIADHLPQHQGYREEKAP